MLQSNLDKWRYFLNETCSPASFIDAGFYYTILASLQRRVWLGTEHNPLYPNCYIIFVAPPGVGKGRVIKQVNYVLRHHKVSKIAAQQPNPASAAGVEDALKGVIDMDFLGKDLSARKHELNKMLEPALSIPIAADAVTFQALLNSVAKSTRMLSYKELDEAGKEQVRTYVHCSLCFILEEVSSIFRAKQEDVVNFMIAAYDCGDYRYETKHNGSDYLHKMCLNFLGGTQPSFIQSLFNNRLLTEGFSSRCWFIYENANTKAKFDSGEFSKEQVKARQEIVDHVGKLIKLYGRVHYTPEAHAYLKHWWEVEHQVIRPNSSIKLEAYYARKNMHLPKLAMAVHFGEKTNMEIDLEDCMKAREVLESWEMKMHLALTFDGRNPLAAVAKRILKYLFTTGPQTRKKIIIEFIEDASEKEIAEVLDLLLKTEKIRSTTKVDRRTNTTIMCLAANEADLDDTNKQKDSQPPDEGEELAG